MPPPSLLAQIFARDPRKLVRFPEYPVDTALAELRNLLDHVEQAKKLAEVPAPAPAPEKASPEEASAALSDTFSQTVSGLITQIWRAKGKMVDPVTGEPKEETKRAYRHVESALDALTQMGVTLNDWVNQPYDPGLPVKVITFQPTPGVMRDTVVEAVKPTVVWIDRLLQLGEVVVGIPPNTEKPQ